MKMAAKKAGQPHRGPIDHEPPAGEGEQEHADDERDDVARDEESSEWIQAELGQRRPQLTASKAR